MFLINLNDLLSQGLEEKPVSPDGAEEHVFNPNTSFSLQRVSKRSKSCGLYPLVHKTYACLKQKDTFPCIMQHTVI